MHDGGLRQRLRSGCDLTLVLGAGVSQSRGLPNWKDLLRKTWRLVYGDDLYADETRLLKSAKNACASMGMPSAFVKRLDVERHPLELQLGFERVFDKIWESSIRDMEELRSRLRLTRGVAKAAVSLPANRRAEFLFAHVLRRVLYEGRLRRAPQWSAKMTDTLSLIAGVLRRNDVRSRTTVARVITFNVDDVLEEVVNSVRGSGNPRVYPVRWPSDTHSPPGSEATAVYHLHGFVPRDPAKYLFRFQDGGATSAPMPVESLVFTDEQYWRAIGNPGDFASRVFAQALGGTCVFIGLSMTDINIMRGLAHHAIETKRDVQSVTASWKDPYYARWTQSEELVRHYWITEKHQGASSDVGDAVLKEVLRDDRGVHCIEVPGWNSKTFRNWWQGCFRS